MFKCELTGKTTKPGEKMKKIIVETREKIYYDDDGVEVARGSEIVKEISVSPTAYDKWLLDHPEMSDQPVTSAYSAPLKVVEPAEEPSEQDALQQAIDDGLVVPVEIGGTVVYVSPAEAEKIRK